MSTTTKNGTKPNAKTVGARQVEWTSEYDVFSRLPGNRDIDLLHVSTLVKAMEKEYIFSPILVNQDFQVLDGQHRLEAHRRLQKPIPFYWDEVGDLEAVQRLNSTQKGWTNADYAQSFVERGFKDYEIYTWFKKSYGLPYTVCLVLLSGSEYRGLSRSFKTGDFKVKNLEVAKKKAVILSQLAPYFTHWKDGGFLRAMNTALRKKGFDVQQFIHKVAVNSTMLVPCTSMDQYMQLIEEVYNFRSSKKVPIRFGEDDPKSPWR